MNRKFDYNVLERQYISGDMSLRELAKSAGMTNYSLVMVQSRKREWARKRAEYRERSSETALVTMADTNGIRIARAEEVRGNAIEAIDEMITRLRGDLKRTIKTMQADGSFIDVPLVVIKPRDIEGLIDKLQVLFGRPSTISEERSLGLNLNTSDPEVLRQLVEATRGLAPDAGGSGLSPIPRYEGTGPN